MLILVVLAGREMTTLDCGSYSAFTAPSFITPAAANPTITVWNQRTTRIKVYHVTSSSGQSPQRRMLLGIGERMAESDDTAGLWFATDKDWINILPLSSIGACYYVTGTGNVTIIIA